MTDVDRSPSDRGQAHQAPRLKDMMRQARVEMAERTAVVVDLHDAELARLEILNDDLAPIFEEIPVDIDLFDRGISLGEPPRLWIDMIAHVVMGRDKRVYRFVQDTRFGRRVLAESAEVADITKAVAHYIARRLVERERAIAGAPVYPEPNPPRRRRRWIGWLLTFLFGFASGFAAIFAAAWYAAGRFY